LLVLASVAAVSLSIAGCWGGGGSDRTPSSTPTVTAAATGAAIGTSPAAATASDASRTPAPAVTLELNATPQELICDGKQASMVTARVLDRAGKPVEDGTRVKFSVQAFGTADPIDTTTRDGMAVTSVVALGQQVGVVVNVTSGDAARAIRIDCE
jgi:hypothetical protein